MFLRKISLQIWLVAGLATSCGPQLTVNLAESALTWRVDDFFDINQKQRQEIKSQFRLFLQDLHQNEIKKAREIVLDSAWPSKTCSDIELQYASIRELFEQGQKKFSIQAESFVDSLEDKQIQYFVEALKEEIKDDEKKSKDPSARLERRIEQTLRTWNELFDDSLTEKQTTELKSHILESSDLSSLFLDNRKRMLSEVEKAQKVSGVQVKEYFKKYLRDRNSMIERKLQEASNERRLKSEAFFLKFVCNASLEQKKTFQSVIRSYLEAIEEIYIKPKA